MLTSIPRTDTTPQLHQLEAMASNIADAAVVLRFLVSDSRSVGCILI